FAIELLPHSVLCHAGGFCGRHRVALGRTGGVRNRPCPAFGGMERLDLPGKHQGLRGFPCQPRSSRPFGWNLLASAWGPSNASTEVVPFFAFSCPIRDDLTWCQRDEGAMVYFVSSRIRPRLFQRADVCFCDGNPGRIPNN